MDAFWKWREANPDASVNEAWHAALEHAASRITALEAREAALVKGMAGLLNIAYVDDFHSGKIVTRARALLSAQEGK